MGELDAYNVFGRMDEPSALILFRTSSVFPQLLNHSRDFRAIDFLDAGNSISTKKKTKDMKL